MKRITWMFLVWLALVSVNIKAADDALPPEVKALIGIKIPAIAPGRRGEAPGWDNLGGSGIDLKYFYEELQKGNITILVTRSINNKDYSTTTHDARVIPANLLDSYKVKGVREFKKNYMQLYRITATCWRELGKQEVIIGFWKYEPGSRCEDSSTLVKKAWLLNPENGRLTDISTKDVACRETNCGQD